VKHLQLVLSYTAIDETGQDSHGLLSTQARTSQCLMIAHDTILLPEVVGAQNGKMSLDSGATHSAFGQEWTKAHEVVGWSVNTPSRTGEGRVSGKRVRPGQGEGRFETRSETLQAEAETIGAHGMTITWDVAER
jgi:hypothetical protein